MARKAPAQRVIAPMYNHTLVVFAPFGTDPKLARYSGTDRPATGLESHALFRALTLVARNGVNVCAYIDLEPGDGRTWHVWAPAFSRTLNVRMAAKIVMESPYALSHLLDLARESYPGTRLVLALEGHGTGFMPHLNRDALTTDIATDGGKAGRLRWRITGQTARLVREDSSSSSPPLLGMGCPVLPFGSPFAPRNHFPLSTAGLQLALNDNLRLSNQKLAAVHLNNCFNMSIEVLDSIQPYAEFATGYPNYNFFTGGLAYPAVFGRTGATPTSGEIARRFAERNGAALPAGHPTAGCTIDLARMPDVTRQFEGLARSLTAALRSSRPDAPARKVTAEKIRRALAEVTVRHYDSVGDFRLDAQDELVDVRSFARACIRAEVDGAVKTAAGKLDAALGTLQVYGESGRPTVASDATWNFEGKELTMNVLCPDPQLLGLWDWRSAFYLHDPSDSRQRKVQPQQIQFMKKTGWRDFIIAYHEHLAFERRDLTIRAPFIPDYPVCEKPANPNGPNPQ